MTDSLLEPRIGAAKEKPGLELLSLGRPYLGCSELGPSKCGLLRSGPFDTGGPSNWDEEAESSSALRSYSLTMRAWNLKRPVLIHFFLFPRPDDLHPVGPGLLPGGPPAAAVLAHVLPLGLCCVGQRADPRLRASLRELRTVSRATAAALFLSFRSSIL
jgi:hypothetical protein